MAKTIDQVIQASVGLVSTWGLQVVGAIVVLVIGRWVAAAIRRAVSRGLKKGGVDASLVPFLSNAVYYVVFAAVLIAVLSLFGIETTSLVAVLGAAGLAVGLALQGTLSNFAAGTMLLLFRPFKAGDFVDVGGAAGTVKEIGIFSTTLNTPDNIRVTIPNSAVYGEMIKNYTVNENRRVDMVVGISYGDDIGRAIETIERVLQGDQRVLSDPAPVVATAELGDSSVNIVVRPWCRTEDYWALKWDLIRAFKQELEAAGCSIPYPQRDVHLMQAGSS